MASSNLIMLFAVAIGESPATTQSAFELYDRDRVVFVGGTFVERDQVYGYLETMLTARWPDRNITFRNLGWSGDTVWGEARARFGTAADGFQHLKEHVESIKPTVIFVAYGANESFAADEGLANFEAGFNTLLDTLRNASAPDARIVLISPLWQENLGPPLPDPTAHNENVKQYAKVIRQIGQARSMRVVDLLGSREPSQQHAPGYFTDNGIHLTPYGYWRTAEEIVGQLQVATMSSSIELGKDGKPTRSIGLRITSFENLPRGLRFEAIAEYLPRPPRPSHPAERLLRVNEFGEFEGRFIEIEGIKAGRYALRIDEEVGYVETSGVVMIEYESGRIEQLRQAIIDKNRLYFHRWRPQNETYLFGFRKHEQGQNAAEVPKFDPLVEEQEKLIAKLRVPVSHTYEIVTRSE